MKKITLVRGESAFVEDHLFDELSKHDWYLNRGHVMRLRLESDGVGPAWIVGDDFTLEPYPKSGVPGVCWAKGAKRWMVQYKKQHLGSFTDLEEAIAVRVAAEAGSFPTITLARACRR